jgi:vacuolar iron transporter family protein
MLSECVFIENKLPCKMEKQKRDSFITKHHRFVFGSTTAIITNLGLITALFFTSNPKINMIGSILVVALADNISDSLGIHIYQETERFKTREVWLSTLTNFIARLLVSMVFVLFITFLPLVPAVIILTVFGMLLLGFISYFVAKRRNRNPYIAIVEHIGIAIFVIIFSRILGQLIISHF